MSVFEVSKFDPQPNPELVCCICYCVLHQPRECRCRHVFCKKCIETWLCNRYTCPTCRMSVRVDQLQPVLPLVQNMLNNLTMICDNREHGCQEKITMEHYENHIKVCDFQTVTCPNHGCGMQVPKNTLADHEQDCPHKTVICEQGCELRMQQLHAEGHNCITALKESLKERDEMLDQYKTAVRWLRQKIGIMQQIDGSPRQQSRYFRDIINLITRFWPSDQDLPTGGVFGGAAVTFGGARGSSSNNHINIDEEISHTLSQPSLLERLMEEASATGARERDRNRRVHGGGLGDREEERRDASGRDRRQRPGLLMSNDEYYYGTDSDDEYFPHSRFSDTSTLSFGSRSSTRISYIFGSSSRSSLSSTISDSDDDNVRGDDGSQNSSQNQDNTERNGSVFGSDNTVDDDYQTNGSRTEESLAGSMTSNNSSDNDHDSGGDGDSGHSFQSSSQDRSDDHHDSNDDDVGDAGVDDEESHRSSDVSERSHSGITNSGDDSDGSQSNHDARDSSEAQSPGHSDHEEDTAHSQSGRQDNTAGGPCSPLTDPHSPQSPSGEPHSPAASSHSEISYHSDGPRFSSDNNSGSGEDNSHAEHSARSDENSQLPNSLIWDSSSHSDNHPDQDHSDHDVSGIPSALSHDSNSHPDGNASNSGMDASHTTSHAAVSSVLGDSPSEPRSVTGSEVAVGKGTENGGESHSLEPVPSCSSSTERDSGFGSSSRKSEDSDKDSETLPQQPVGDPSSAVDKGRNSGNKLEHSSETKCNAWDKDSDTTSLDYSSDHAVDESAPPVAVACTAVADYQAHTDHAISGENADSTLVPNVDVSTAPPENQQQGSSRDEPEVSTSLGRSLGGSSSSDDEEDKPEKRRIRGKGKGKSASGGKGKALSVRKQATRPVGDSDSDSEAPADSGVGRKRKLQSKPIPSSSDSEPSTNRAFLTKKLCLTVEQSDTSGRNEAVDGQTISTSTVVDSSTANRSPEGNGIDESRSSRDKTQRKHLKKTATSANAKQVKSGGHCSFSKETQTSSNAATTDNIHIPSTSSGYVSQTDMDIRSRLIMARDLLKHELQVMLRQLMVPDTPEQTTASPASLPLLPPSPPILQPLTPLQLSQIPVADHRLLNQVPLIRLGSPVRLQPPAAASSPVRSGSPARVRSPVRSGSPARVRSHVRSRSPVRNRSPARRSATGRSHSTRARTSSGAGVTSMTLRNRRGSSRHQPARARQTESNSDLVRIPDIPVPPSTYQLLNMYAGNSDSDSTWSPDTARSQDSD